MLPAVRRVSMHHALQPRTRRLYPASSRHVEGITKDRFDFLREKRRTTVCNLSAHEQRELKSVRVRLVSAEPSLEYCEYPEHPHNG